MITDVHLAISPNYAIHHITEVSPSCSNISKEISTPPASLIGVLRHTQAILYQVEESRRIAFRDKKIVWVRRTKRSYLYMLFEPLFRQFREVRTTLVEAVVLIP